MIDAYYDNNAQPLTSGLSPEEQIKDLGIPDRRTIGQHFLDTDERTQRYFRLVSNWFSYERQKQSDSRLERIKAHDYKDGDQWSEEDAAIVEARGQKASVFNMIKPSCDWLVGTEKRTRVDFSVLPRRKEESEAAETKTKLLKYLSDVSKSGFARSLAFEDAVISGKGWLDHGVKTNDEEEPLYVRYVDWRNVWDDSFAKERDCSDARYIFVSKIVDYDVAVAMFPDRADCILLAMNATDNSMDEFLETDVNPEADELSGMDNAIDMDNHRDRIRLVSCEYRIPTAMKVMRGKDLGTLNGTEYDEKDVNLEYLVRNGHASLYDATKMVMWKMIFCGPYVLQNRRRIYNHNRFSLVPIWGYKKKRDNSPYGIVLNQMDPQDDMNKRRSKALFILSTKQSMSQENAIDDHDAFIEERDRADGHMIVNDINGVKLIEERSLAKEHIMLMEQDKEYIESTSGVSDEARGVETNAVSGIAMQTREKQSHVTTAELFDNYRHAFQVSGEIQLSLIEQFYTQEKTFRLTGDKGLPEFTEINGAGEGGETINDITATQADYIIEADSYHASIRQAMFESFGEIITRLPPEISIQLLDLWIDLSDLPGKDVMVERIRQMNGQADPDQNQDDPEVQMRVAAEQESERRRQEIDQRIEILELEFKEAEINAINAKSEKDAAEAQAKIARVRTDIELARIKKADVLNRIEMGERQPVQPEQPKQREKG